jgi:hypothetical protein
MSRVASNVAVALTLAAGWVGLNLVADTAASRVTGVQEPGFTAPAPAPRPDPELVAGWLWDLKACQADRDSLAREVDRLRGVAQVLRAQRDAAWRAP